MNRNKIYKIVMAAGLLLAAWFVPADAEVIRLKDGRELHCEIIASSEDNGITVRRLDNGGVFDLRWEHLLEDYFDNGRLRPASPLWLETARGYFCCLTRDGVDKPQAGQFADWISSYGRV